MAPSVGVLREIVVGMPLMLDGSRGVQAEKVEAFIAALRNSVRIPISVQDERFPTGESERLLIAAVVRRDKRKQTVDSVAASLILGVYLDRKRALAQSADADPQASDSSDETGE